VIVCLGTDYVFDLLSRGSEHYSSVCFLGKMAPQWCVNNRLNVFKDGWLLLWRCRIGGKSAMW